MKFIGCLTEEQQIADNVLTDGRLSLSYQQIPHCFKEFSQVFTKLGIKPHDYVVLPVDNTLPTALTLLYLLENAYSMFLLPSGSLNNTAPDLPSFCRYILTTQLLDKEDADALNPKLFLSITMNPAWESNNPLLTTSFPKLLMRTSGSTGIPKLAVYAHEKLRGNVLNCVHRFGLSYTDRVTIPVPIYHMYGLGAAFLPSVAVGATIDLQKSSNLLTFIQRETPFNPNLAFMTPSFAYTLLQTRKSKRPYRLTVTAGDRFRLDSFADYEVAFGPLLQLYGSTELGAIAAADPTLPIEVRRRSVGLPMPDVACRLQTPVDGEGELWCKRRYGFEGYVDKYGKPVSLGTDYVDGWFRTKDIARFNPDGSLEVLGRSDHSVNRDGLLVFFADLEKTIETLEPVEAVAIVTGDDTERGKKLIAYCVIAKDSNLSADMIRTHCFDKLPRRVVPDEIRLLDTLPLLPSGKVDRITLQQQFS